MQTQDIMKPNQYFKYGDHDLPARWVTPGKTIPEFWGTNSQWNSVDNPMRWMQNAVGITPEEYQTLCEKHGAPKD